MQCGKGKYSTIVGMPVDGCLNCESSKYVSIAGASSCVLCPGSGFSTIPGSIDEKDFKFSNSDGLGPAIFCDCNAGYTGYSGTAEEDCTSNLDAAPFCLVTLVLPGIIHPLFLTIDVVETDFSSPSEYITTIYARSELLGTNLLQDGGRDATIESCNMKSRVVSTALPIAAVQESDGVSLVRVRIRTSETVGGNAVCGGKTL
jgi:hypothetical protein